MGLNDDFPIAHFIEIIMVHFQAAPIGHYPTRFLIVSNRIVYGSRVKLLSPKRAICSVRPLSHSLVSLQVALVYN